VAGELDHQIAGESVRTLDDDRPRAVAHQALQHLREAGPLADRISPAYRRVVKGLDNFVARRPSVGLDGRSLAFVAVLVRADVRAARSPQIGDGFPDFLAHLRSSLNV
jgi:hypothetical protein